MSTEGVGWGVKTHYQIVIGSRGMLLCMKEGCGIWGKSTHLDYYPWGKDCAHTHTHTHKHTCMQQNECKPIKLHSQYTYY